MPQVDIETLVSACAGGGSDRKIACETLADTIDDNTAENDDVHDRETFTGADYPPESFWLSKDAEFDWFDRNAFLERKESTKGISNSATTTVHPSSISSSQRFSLHLTSNASIIGLPKTRKASYVDTKRRNGAKPANIRLLPNRPATIGKQAITLTEPSSPKVSCIGRVRSKKKNRRPSQPGKNSNKPAERSNSKKDKRKTGFGSKFMAMFRSGKSHKKPVQQDVGKVTVKSTATELPNKSLTSSKRVRENPVIAEPMGDPPGLGGMKRFASGRRNTDEFDAALTGSSELDPRAGPNGSS